MGSPAVALTSDEPEHWFVSFDNKYLTPLFVRSKWRQPAVREGYLSADPLPEHELELSARPEPVERRVFDFEKMDAFSGNLVTNSHPSDVFSPFSQESDRPNRFDTAPHGKDKGSKKRSKSPMRRRQPDEPRPSSPSLRSSTSGGSSPSSATVLGKASG